MARGFYAGSLAALWLVCAVLYTATATAAATATATATAAAGAHAHRHTHSTRRGLHGTLNLEQGKAATEHLLSLLYNRYEMFDPSLYGIYLLRPYLNMDIHTWDLLKYKYALKMLTGEDFMCIFAGSSVTAGHDNFLNESYPMVYERRMAGPLRALGIDLKVHELRSCCTQPRRALQQVYPHICMYMYMYKLLTKFCPSATTTSGT
jgi:hypothetical protein